MKLLLLGVLATTVYFVESQKCEPVVVSLCKGLAAKYNSDKMYNTTMYPNSLSHRNQEEAGLEVHQFFPLIKVGCSKYLQLFLCTVYVPMCSKPMILPCRSLCEEARNGCLPLMRNFGFQWPEQLKCSKYPKKGDGVCFGGPTNKTEKTKEKSNNCAGCLSSSIDVPKLRNLCENHDMVLVGKVLNIRGDRRVKFRVRKEIKIKSNIGKVIRKRLQQKKMMVKLSFPNKACIGKCGKFEIGKTYVVFLKVKKGKRAIYDQAGVILHNKGMKIC